MEHIQRKLDIKDLLSECKKAPKRIYIEGVAGAGKSTLSRYIVHQWSLNREPWKQYRWVFHIKLRELTENNYTEKNTEPLKVFERECFGLGHGINFKKEEIESLEKAMRENPNQVLLVLDGVDELQLTTNYVREIWQSLITSNYDLLFTSRPGAQFDKRQSNINFNLVILGFSDEQIEKYIKNFFNLNNTPQVKAEDANNCLNMMKKSSNLWSLAHTPIQLEIICSIWEREWKEQELNLTNLYRLMLEKILKRYSQFSYLQKGEINALPDLDIKLLKEKYRLHLYYMEYLAFLGMQEKIIVLSEKQINETSSRLPKTSVKPVKFYRQLKGLGLIKKYNNCMQAEFVHLTFQEFFAAKYITRAIKAFCEGKVEALSHEALLEFIIKTKWDLFYEVMWWFVAGLLAGKTNQYLEQKYYRYSDSEKIVLKLPKSHICLQRLQVFFDLLLQEPRNGIRYEELLLLARCLEEARLPEVMQKETIIIHIQYYYENCIKNSNNIWNIAFEKIKNIVKFIPIIVKYRIIKEFIKILQNDDYIGSRTFKADSTISQGEAVLELYNPSLLRVAITSLGELGHVGPDIAIPALIKVLKSKDRRVRYFAAEALGKIGPQAPMEVVSALLEGLKDQDGYVRTAAAKGLGKVGAQVPGNVIAALLEGIKDQDGNVCYAVIDALGEVGAQAPEKVISALCELLINQDSYKRCAAVKALGKISSVSQFKFNSYLVQIQNNAFMPKDAEKRKEIIILILSNIKTVPLSFFIYSIKALFPDQPLNIPPSNLICSPKDIVKVSDEGKLLTLKLCGEVMESIISNYQESHVINQDFWTISIVRKREGVRQDNTSPGFFKSIKFTNGLFDHAFILIEGVYQSVRFAKKIDLYAEKSKASQSSGQRIRIEVTDVHDFNRLQNLAENCSCMVQGISRQKAEQLEEIIKRDQAAAECGEIIYNIKGDGSLSNKIRDKKEHSCISWCLEKWQEIGLPLQRKWYDAIVVLPKVYLPEPESKDEKCLTM